MQAGGATKGCFIYHEVSCCCMMNSMEELFVKSPVPAACFSNGLLADWHNCEICNGTGLLIWSSHAMSAMFTLPETKVTSENQTLYYRIFFPRRGLPIFRGALVSFREGKTVFGGSSQKERSLYGLFYDCILKCCFYPNEVMDKTIASTSTKTCQQ